MVPQYMICILILSEHNKGIGIKKISLITQFFQRVCICLYFKICFLRGTKYHLERFFQQVDLR